ncbi:unnamed protein product [Protopolystoma xenopodis]|uniref:Uncharacterized protein n=1 Tax=Protopolystoma xenopodis TaxID=117903 RepID=A0A3S5CNA5_9PLAT|nr:unnamed protein product [Protopolystoma xenopodis]
MANSTGILATCNETNGEVTCSNTPIGSLLSPVAASTVPIPQSSFLPLRLDCLDSLVDYLWDVNLIEVLVAWLTHQGAISRRNRLIGELLECVNIF